MLLYLYCLLPGAASVDLSDVEPMESGRLRALPVGQLKAVVSEVGDEFGNELNSRVQDLEWLSPRAVRHHQVIDSIYVRQPLLLPLSFGALFRSEESLKQRIVRGSGQLLDKLAQLRGMEQWDLKVRRDDARFLAAFEEESPDVRALREEITRKPAGTAFMLTKKLDRLRQDEARRVSLRLRSDITGALRSQAEEERLDDLTVAGKQLNTDLVLKASYLLRTEKVAGIKLAVASLVEKLAPLGYTFELTGPWPAFGFAGQLREALA